ncbi:MAG: hypothetical protein Q8N26_32820 [Myxococcales bacterium]|nr:hypothetical protein [Myxococcales bacterium]
MAPPHTSPAALPGRRWWPRALVLSVLVVAGLPWLATVALESEAAKTAMRARLGEAGVDATWSALSVSLVGATLVVRDVKVARPGLEATASEVEVAWVWRPLFAGQLHLRSVRVDDVRVTISPTPAAADGADTPSGPRSGLLSARSVPLQLDSLSITPLEVSVIDEAGSLHASRLSLEGRAQHVPGGLPVVTLELRGGVVEHRRGDDTLRATLTAKVNAALEAQSVALKALVVLDALEPSLPLPSSDVLSLSARVRLLPEEHRVTLELDELTSFRGALRGTLRGSLADDAVLPALESARLSLELDPLADLLHHLVPGVRVRSGRAVLSAEPTRGEPWTTLKGEVSAERVEGQGAVLEGVAVSLEGRTSLSQTHATLEARVKTADWSDGRQQVRAEQLGLNAAVESLATSLRQGGLTAGLTVASARARQGKATQAVGPVRLDAKGSLVDGRLALKLAGPLGAVSHSEADLRASLGAARLELDVAGLTPSLEHASAATRISFDDARVMQASTTLRVAAGAVRLEALRDLTTAPSGTVSIELRRLTAWQAAAESSLATLGGDFDLALEGAILRRLSGTLRTTGLQFRDRADAAPLQLGDGKVTITARDLSASAGHLEVAGVVPPLTVDASVDLTGFRLDGKLHVRTPVLGPLVPLLPEMLGDVRLEPAATSLAADVTLRVEDVRALERGVVGDGALHLKDLRGRRDDQSLAADGLDVFVTLRHQPAADTLSTRLVLQRPRIDDVIVQGDVEARLDAALNRTKGTARVQTSVRAPEGELLTGALLLNTASGGRVHHTLSLDAHALGPLAPLVSALSTTPLGLELAPLGVHFESEGDTVGLVDAQLSPMPHWAAESDTNFHGRLTVTDVVHRTPGERLTTPRLELRLDAGVLHGALSVTSSVESPRVDLDLGDAHATFIGLHQTLTLRSDGRPDAGLVHLTLKGVLDELDQSFAPAWRPREVRLDAEGRVDALTAWNVDQLVLSSPLAGTRLELKKRLRTDTGPRSGASAEAAGGQRFLLEGRFTQDLARLDGQPAAFRGRGQVAMPFVVDSADQSLFRLRGRLEFDDVHLTLPGARVEVTGLTGNMPLEEAVMLDPERGLRLVPSTQREVFARARSHDVQPIFSGDGQVTMQTLRVADFELAPVVASLELERNRFSLNKLKAQRGPARLAGQLFLDYLPGNETVSFRGSLTGLTRAGEAEPLDANAALVFHPARLELDGRVQVVRMGRAHLLDMLDLLDPHRELSSLNRVRAATAWGFPRQAQLSLGDGLLSMDVEFGGLAGLFDLGTVRGVSLGPLLNRYLAPAFAERKTP